MEFNDIKKNLGDAFTAVSDKVKEMPKMLEQKRIVDMCVSAHLKSCVDADHLNKMIEAEFKNRNIEGTPIAVKQFIENRIGGSLDDVKTHQQWYGIHKRG